MTDAARGGIMENGTHPGAVDAVVEAKAIANVVEAFRPLDPAAIRRVLEWASKRYAGAAVTDVTGAPPVAVRGDDRGADRLVGDIAELYTAANPRTESESVLIAA